MKLVIAIIHDEDTKLITSELVKLGLGVTKLCSTGGFLKKGNTTLLIGVRNSKVNSVIEIIKNNSKSRKYTYNYSLPPYFSEGMDGSSFGMSSTNYNIGSDNVINDTDKTTKSGAVVFVLNIESFSKVLRMY